MLLDGPGFYAELRASLRAAQTVDAPELEALAAKRGEALVSALTGEGGIEPARVSLSPTQQVPEKDAGSELVASRLTLSVN